jgi:putative cell wall-binding protein
MRRVSVAACTVMALAGGSLATVAAPAARAASAPATWTSVTPSPMPPIGESSSLVFDPATGQLLAYDSYNDGDCSQPQTQVWTWDGAAWTNHRQIAPPQGRGEAAFGFDPTSHQVVMFGGDAEGNCPGDTFNGLENETWSWNGSIWAQQHPAVSPPARYTACAAADDATGQFLMYGGMGDGNGEPFDLNDTWNWTGTSWQQLSPATSPPGGECQMTYDAARKVVVMLVDAPAAAPDAGVMQTWMWNGSTWTQGADMGAPAVYLDGPVPVSFDPDTGTDLAYVGQTTCTTLGPMESQCVQADQLWTFGGSAWSQAPAANNPQTGAGFAAAYDASTHQFVITGGAINYTDGANDATLLYASPESSTVTPTRLAGTNRQATAVAVSQSQFPARGSAQAVVLARADVFADALAGGPLAAAKRAPLLLTSSGSLDEVTKAEITRVLPAGGTVYVLGGTSALSDAVASAITGLGDVVQRVAGADRFATAVAIADTMGDPNTVFEASGTNFPDALSAVPAAIATHGAILLTNGSTQTSATAAYLNAHATTRYAVGGPAAWADPSAIALAGATRYATSQAVALAFFPDATGISVASGVTFPDALAGGVLAGTTNQPMLLVPASGPLPEPTAAYLTTRHVMVTQSTVDGGTSAISNETIAAIGTALT